MAQRRDIKCMDPEWDTIVLRLYFKVTKRFNRRIQQHETTCDGGVGAWRLDNVLQDFLREQPEFCGVKDVIEEIKDDTRGWDGDEGMCIEVVLNRAKCFKGTIPAIKGALCEYLEAACKARDE